MDEYRQIDRDLDEANSTVKPKVFSALLVAMSNGVPLCVPSTVEGVHDVFVQLRDHETFIRIRDERGSLTGFNTRYIAMLQAITDEDAEGFLQALAKAAKDGGEPPKKPHIYLP